VIVDVLMQEPLTDVALIKSQYADCDIEVYEHSYVLPGLVDCNVRLNGEWEGSGHATKSAISGGVTVLATEGTIYSLETEINELYCDIGFIGIVQCCEDIQAQLSKGVLAVKAYQSPPSNIIQAVCLSEILAAVARTSVPLILDINKPDGHLLYLASPFRTLPVNDRFKLQAHRLRSHAFAGAIASNVEDQDKDLSDEEESPGLAPEPQTHATQVKQHSETYSELLVSERSTYNKSGSTLFQRSQTVREELQAYIPKTPSTGTPRSLFRDRISPIRIESSTTEPSLYSHFISNWPSNWEINGIKVLTQEFAKHPCRVHIANMSNPGALSELHKLRCKYKNMITCETCPHYLIFSDRHIVDGDTRFKCAPPIRNEATRALLWDLVNMTMVDTISSAHNPIPPALKFVGDFSKAVSGITGLGFCLQAMWTVVKERVPATLWDKYIVKLVRWMGTSSADILGLKDRGRIATGAAADFVIWEPSVESRIHKSQSRHPSMCPYIDFPLFGEVRVVYLRGKLAYSEGSFLATGQVLCANHLMKA